MKRMRIPAILVSLLMTLSLLTSAAWAATPPQDDGPTGPIETLLGTAPTQVEGGGGIQSLSGSNVTFAPASGIYTGSESLPLAFQTAFTTIVAFPSTVTGGS